MAINRNQLSPLTPVSIRQNVIPEVQAGQGFGLLSGITDPIGNGQWQYGADMQQPLPDPIGSGQWQYGQGVQPQQSAGYRGESPEMTAMYERWINGQKSPMDGFGNKMLGMLNNQEALAQLALGFNSMRLQPDQALAAQLGSEVKTAREQRKENATKNATIEALRQMGLEEGELKLLANNPELLKVAATAMYKQKHGLDTTAELTTFRAFAKYLKTPEDEEMAARIALGLSPRAAPSLSISPELLAQRALYERLGTKAGEARAEDVATTQKRIELKGQFDYLFGNLRQALGATSMTGPILGNLPSMTTADQIVDHAISMLQEPLKNVSRGKGEGTFTEGDAKVLLNMMPTRGMTTEAAARSLDALMQFINLKLQNPTLNLEEFFKNLPTTSSIAREASSGAVQSANPQVQSTPAPQSPKSSTSARQEADRILQGTR